MYQGILIFLVCGLYADGKWSFFWMSFFFVLQGYVSKNSKKKRWNILRLSFFNEKYRYFATFDQQILAEKLVFRILQRRFSRGSAISKMIVSIYN